MDRAIRARYASLSIDDLSRRLRLAMEDAGVLAESSRALRAVIIHTLDDTLLRRAGLDEDADRARQRRPDYYEPR